MGLLDEAIREHLELKRRRGADPSAVAREEHEALAPVFPDEDAHPGDDDGHPGRDTPEAGLDVAPAEVVSVDGHSHGDAQLADPSTVGQDTAELDMQAVMDEVSDAVHGVAPVGQTIDEPVRAAYARELPEEDSLEWEVPASGDRDSVPDDVPGQERLSFD